MHTVIHTVENLYKYAKILECMYITGSLEGKTTPKAIFYLLLCREVWRSRQKRQFCVPGADELHGF
jgi:hypothetical protein